MDELDYFVDNAFSLVMSGYYRVKEDRSREILSLKEALSGGRAPVIAEFKRRTPSVRELSSGVPVRERLAEFYRSGVCGFSVLTEPHRFDGALANVPEASSFGIPVIMKDFIISTDQIDAARRLGADCVLLILEIFNRSRYNLDVLMEDARSAGLEIVLEVNSVEQYRQAMETDADIIGINNRNLSDLSLEPRRTEEILSAEGKDRPVIGMSGIRGGEQAAAMIRAGADGVLVGTSVMGGDAGLLNEITEAAASARSENMR